MDTDWVAKVREKKTTTQAFMSVEISAQSWVTPEEVRNVLIGIYKGSISPYLTGDQPVEVYLDRIAELEQTVTAQAREITNLIADANATEQILIAQSA